MDPTLSRLIDKVAIVTGASAGIGEAIVEVLVEKGLQVVGLARRLDRLEMLAERLQDKAGKFHYLETDVTKEEDIANAFLWVKENLGPVHVLINNAGVTRPKGLIDGDVQSWKEIFDTNVIGLCIATKLAVNDMKENDTGGHIIHINSITGHKIPSFPDVNVYPASKWAVTALTETLRQELNSIGSKIKVTSISPGVVQTEFMIAAGVVVNDEQKETMAAMPSLRPEDIADSVVYVLSTPPHVQVHELIIKPIGECI